MKRILVLITLSVILTVITAYSLIDFQQAEGDSDKPSYMPLHEYQSADLKETADLTNVEAQTVGRSLTAAYIDASLLSGETSFDESDQLFTDELYGEKSLEDFRQNKTELQNLRLDFLKEQVSSISNDSFTYRSEFSLIASPKEKDGMVEETFILIADLTREEEQFQIDYITVDQLPND